MFKRVVIKISGEEIAGNSSEHFHTETVDRIIDEIIQVKNDGVQVSMVIGGGNFWRGRDAKSDMDKVKAHQIGMLGTIMNGIYLCEAFRIRGIESIVMTPFDVNGFTTKYTKEQAVECLKSGKVVIFSGGTGHPFFSTDSIVAIRACELNAGAVLYAKNIDGVYDADPRKNKDAKKFRTLSYNLAIGNNLAVADITALCLTRDENIPSVVFAVSKPGAIVSACRNNGEIYKVGGTTVANNIEEDYYV